jgi:hypothetical protein
MAVLYEALHGNFGPIGVYPETASLYVPDDHYHRKSVFQMDPRVTVTAASRVSSPLCMREACETGGNHMPKVKCRITRPEQLSSSYRIKIHPTQRNLASRCCAGTDFGPRRLDDPWILMLCAMFGKRSLEWKARQEGERCEREWPERGKTRVEGGGRKRKEAVVWLRG